MSSRRFRSQVHDPTGCGLEVHVPTSVMSWFPSSTIQFSGSVSRRPGRSRGGRLMLTHRSRQVFSCGIFSDWQSARLTSYNYREPGVPFRSCRFRPGSPPRNPRFSLRLSPEAGGPGWLEGRRGLPRTLFPVKRLFAAKFLFEWREGRSPHVAEARDRLSPIGSARQDQFLRESTPRYGDSAHRPPREQTPGARGADAIAKGI